MNRNILFSPERAKPKVMDKDIQKKEDGEHSSIYEMRSPDGHAIMQSFPIFSGVELTFQEVYMKQVKHEAKPLQGMFELHYCKEGRVECAFENGRVLYMDENDVSVGWKESAGYLHTTKFPTSYFKGINLSVYIPQAQEALNTFVGHDRIDLREVCNRFCKGYDFGLICRKDSRLSKLFDTLYDIPKDIEPMVYQLKCMEILVLLSSMTAEHDCCIPYFEKRHVDSVKKMHEYLISNLSQKVTIEELSERYGLAPTALKKCFKGIYGSSIHQYVKHYRMKEAAKDLGNTDMSILNIANKYGYENASKFAEAFRVVMGEKPSEYRKKKKMSKWID